MKNKYGIEESEIHKYHLLKPDFADEIVVNLGRTRGGYKTLSRITGEKQILSFEQVERNLTNDTAALGQDSPTAYAETKKLIEAIEGKNK